MKRESIARGARRLLSGTVALFFAFLLVGNARADLEAGDLVAVRRFSATNNQVISIDPQTGEQEVVYSNSSLGAFDDLVVHSESSISLLHCCRDFRISTIDLPTGEYHEITTNLFARPLMLAAPDGGFYVAVLLPPAIEIGLQSSVPAIIHVARDTGVPTVISQGGDFFPIGSLNRDLCGDFIVGSGSFTSGGIARVSAMTGARYTIPTRTSFRASGSSTVVTQRGDIITIPDSGALNRPSPIIHLDTLSGETRVLSVLNDSNRFHTMVLGENGLLYIESDGRIVVVDPETGGQSDLTSGTGLRGLGALEVVPSGAALDKKAIIMSKKTCRSRRTRLLRDHLLAFPIAPDFGN